MPRDRGFTLIELIVSLTIISMVALALFASLRMALRAWNQGSNRINASVRTRIGTDLIRKQLGCISQITHASETPGVPRGQNIPAFRGDNKKITFVTLSALNFQENPGLTLATYFLDGREGRQFLMESERRYPGVDSLMQGIPDANPTPIVEDVEDIEFRFLEKIEDPPGSQNFILNWVDDWDSELRTELPQAVELKVLMRNFNARIPGAPGARELRIVVPVISKPPVIISRRQPFRPTRQPRK